MVPRPDPVSDDDSLPTRTKVLIIGGGIIGTSAAFFLADKGVPVVLCEKGMIGGEQSGRNWGWVRTIGRDVDELPLAVESMRLWRDLNRSIDAETGYREAGILYLCDRERELAGHESWLEQARPFQLGARILTPVASRRWCRAERDPSRAASMPPAMAGASRRRPRRLWLWPQGGAVRSSSRVARCAPWT